MASDRAKLDVKDWYGCTALACSGVPARCSAQVGNIVDIGAIVFVCLAEVCCNQLQPMQERRSVAERRARRRWFVLGQTSECCNLRRGRTTRTTDTMARSGAARRNKRIAKRQQAREERPPGQKYKNQKGGVRHRPREALPQDDEVRPRLRLVEEARAQHTRRSRARADGGRARRTGHAIGGRARGTAA